MIILSSTTDSLALTTFNGSVYDIDVVSVYIDRVTSTGIVGAAQRELENVTSATTLDIVEEPAADTTRRVMNVSIRNTGDTSVDVTVSIDANGTFYELHETTLLAGEVLIYTEKTNWFKIVDTTRLERILIKTSDQTISSNVAFVDITDLTVPLKAGLRYGVFAVLMHNQTAATNGAQFAYNIGNAPTAARFATIDIVTASVTAAAFSAGSQTATDTAFTAQTTGSTTIGPCYISGFIQPSADGTFALRMNEEENTANGMTVYAGSFMRVFRSTG